MASTAQTTRVRAFRGLRYAPDRVDLADVVCPPFDVVGRDEARALAARSPYNAIHLILPEPGGEDDVFRTICRWRADGILALDDEPGHYLLEQHYTGPDGVARLRRGFVALVGVEPYEAGIVRRHEQTRPGPVAGRLSLLRATRAHLSPIFGLYSDPGGAAMAALDARPRGEPIADVTDTDGTRHRMWRVTGAEDAVAEALARSPIVIADGHHRYETALAYFRERGGCPDDAAAYLPVYLVEGRSEGLTVFPTHRVVAGVADEVAASIRPRLVADGYDVDAVPDVESALARIGPVATRSAVVVARAGRPSLVVQGPTGMLDADLAQAAIIGPLLGLDADAAARSERLTFHHRSDDAVVAAGTTGLALLVRPPTVAQVEDVAAAGETMPPKTTYFYPKTLDGLVFELLEECR